MQIQYVILKTAIVAAWFSMPFAVLAQDQTLSLKHGVYIQSGTSREDAPFAAMKSWDGIGFGDPHSSKCTSRVLTHQGKRYTLSTACSALGDGTPNGSVHADQETVMLIRLSDTSFAVWNATKPKSTYRWCTAK